MIFVLVHNNNSVGNSGPTNHPPPPPTDPQRTPTDPNGPQRTCYEVIKTIIYLRELTEDDLSKKIQKFFKNISKSFQKCFQFFSKFPFCLIRVNMQ